MLMCQNLSRQGILDLLSLLFPCALRKTNKAFLVVTASSDAVSFLEGLVIRMLKETILP